MEGEVGLSALPALASLHVLCPGYLALDAQCLWLLLCLESTLLCPSLVPADVRGKAGPWPPQPRWLEGGGQAWRLTCSREEMRISFFKHNDYTGVMCGESEQAQAAHV